MNDPTFQGGLPDADTLGVFTSRPTVAETFHRARLPYWFIHPLPSFYMENVLRVVKPLDAEEWIELEAAEDFVPITVGPALKERIYALHKATDALPWYKNPFASDAPDKPLEMKPSAAGPSAAWPSTAGTSRLSDGLRHQEIARQTM
ncbi:hypothetical protein B0H14DRAFT_2655899 [Mycena olivaceomarginata]|nr:hypothetical protein B0H14DRAFT_2655899 [Mycena olivaceomarginata]